MLGPDAFKHGSRKLAAADKKADGHRAHCAGECGMLGLSLGWLFRGYLVSREDDEDVRPTRMRPTRNVKMS